VGYEIAHELINGTLFVLDVQMVLIFYVYVAMQIFRDRSDRRYGGMTRTYDEDADPVPFRRNLSWYERAGTKAAIALMVHLLGTTIRAGWLWWLLSCQRQHGYSDCAHVTETWGVLFFATLLALIGGLCVIRIFSPPPWRPWSWMGAGVSALTLPVVHYFI
jgi:hypothetical protein